MAAPKLDQELFYRHVGNLWNNWKENKKSSQWSDVDAFCIIAGKTDDSDAYRKSVVTQMYLLGYFEFPETIMVFTEKNFIVLTSMKKYAMLLEIMDGNVKSEVKLELLKRNKSDGNEENYKSLLNSIHASFEGKKVGLLKKESPKGGLAEGFLKVLNESKELEQLDISKGIESVLVTKEAEEIENLRWAGALSSKVFKLKFIEDMEAIIDEEKSIKHEDLASDIQLVIEDPSKIKLTLNAEVIEPCYTPIIQSGGTYDLRPGAISNSDPMKYDVIICSLGARFKGYCSSVARTFFIDPVKCMERTYEILREAHERFLLELKPGTSIQKITEKIKRFIEGENPKLIPKLTKNFGFGIGLEFKESTLLLSTKNTTIITSGMAFNVAFGFHDVPIHENQRKKNGITSFSCFLGDTVVVTETETKAFTRVSKQWSKVHYNIDDDEDKDDKDDDDEDQQQDTKKNNKKDDNSTSIKNKKKDSSHPGIDTSLSSGTRNQVLQSRLRDQQRQLEGKETDQERRERHQQELMKKKREEALRRLQQQNEDGDDGKGSTKKSSIVAYRNPEDYPSDTRNGSIQVDMSSESVFLPINGIPVPFHISTIKNISKSEEEKATYLRINFYTPGQSSGRELSSAMQKEITKHMNKMFIKELGFRSVEARNLNMQYRMIKELQKRVRQRELREQEESDLVVQEDLILTRDRRVPRLSDLSIRPPLSRGKSQGYLEAHSNGLRFNSLKGERVDILYANIKHAIFQPCEKELVVLVHFHLKNFIMIGKKKHKDVQFYTEVMEASQALDNRRRSMYDPDEFDEESRERALRQRLNQTFKDFCLKVEDCADKSQYQITFDRPYRELGFQGTPFKEMVLLQPTVNCLVNLTEHPFFIISLDDIEHVHFERVMFSSKNFDLVIVLKNFDILPSRISAIPMTEIDSIKEWLDDIDVVFTTGTANLNWKSIMATIKDDDRFYLDTDADGVPKPAGWEFLKMDGSDDESGDEDEGSNYSEEEDDNESDDASDASESESDDSDLESLVEEEESEAPSEEDAPDWDELEQEAAAADRAKSLDKRAAEDDDEEDYQKSKKRRR